jgi:ABC-type multidrug transport system ATPase subunit
MLLILLLEEYSAKLSLAVKEKEPPLITDPSIIFLDEPTSGLDSFKALTIVKLL